MKLIRLHGKWGQGLFAKVSDEDYEKVSKYKWSGHLDNYSRKRKDGIKTIYVRTYLWENSIETMVYLHHLIAGKERGLVVDHINRDTLDNKRSNLRVVSQRINNLNRIPRILSGGLGAVKVKSGKWRSQLKVNDKQTYLGLFNTKEEAHQNTVNVYKKLKNLRNNYVYN